MIQLAPVTTSTH